MKTNVRASGRLLLALTLVLPGMAWAEDIEIEVEADPAPVPPPPVPPAEDPALKARLAESEKRLADSEKRLAELEGRLATLEAPKPKAQEGIRVSGYAQAQVVFNQVSVDEVDPEGDPLNVDRFLVRRARLKFSRDFPYGQAQVELDANTVNGPSVGVKRVELSGFYPNKEASLPPLARLTVGLTEIPFGFELPQSSRERLFLERSLGSRAFFPGEYDVGARLSGAFGPLRYGLGVQNGVPINGVSNSVYTEEKTLVGRLGFETERAEAFRISGGVSYLTGTGFHAGTPATKSQLLWSDSNQDGLVTLNELEAVNGQAATASATFPRWGVNADLQTGFKTPLGWTQIFAEATMASNLDRDYYPADPISTGYSLRELAWTAGATQEITRWGIAGFRADSYDPNSDFFESRRGDFIPTDVSVLTLSPVLGAQLPGVARLLVQYDYVVDFEGRDNLGIPIDLPNDQWTVRVQGEF